MNGTAYDPPGEPDFRPPTIKEGFGFELDKEIPPSMQLGVSTAGDLLAVMLAKLNDALTSAWADAAVTTDLLQAKLNASIGGALDTAAGVADQLQHPIATGLVGQLGSAVEAGMQLGALAPMPATIGQNPPCVQIREAAAAGDIGPAIECYRKLAWPQRFTRGKNYTDVIEYIQKAIPAGSAAQEEFANAVLQLQNLPDVPGSPPAAGPDHSADATFAASVEAPAPGQTFSAAAPGQDCLAQIAAWAGAALAAQERCNQQFANDPFGLGQCQAAVVEMANRSIPGCAPAGFGFGPGGPTFNGRPWNPSSGVPGHPEQKQPPKAPAKPPAARPGPGQPIPGGGVPQGPGGLPGGSGGGSGAGPGAGPPVNCVPDAGTVLQFFSDQANQLVTVVQACAAYQASTGLQCVPATGPGNCPTDFTYYEVPLYASPGVHGVCIGCPAEVPPCGNQTVSVPSCGTVVVQCCPQVPATSAPPGQPGQQPGPSAPAAPAVPGFRQANPGACDDLGEIPLPGNVVDVDGFLQWIGIADINGQPTIPFPDAGIADVGKSIGNGLATFFEQLLIQGFKAVGSAINQNGCGAGDQLGLIAVSCLIEGLGGLVGAALDQTRIPLQQQRQFNCPVKLPTAGEAASAWIHNEIDAFTRDCWIRADNFRPEKLLPVIRSQRAKFAPAQLAILRNRGFISDAVFNAGVRAYGHIEEWEPEQIRNLAGEYPSVPEILQFASRESTNEQAAQEFQLDDDLATLQGGKLAEWLKGRGVSDDHLQQLWRSHWTDPGIGTVGEMFQRSRGLDQADPGFVSEDLFRTTIGRSSIAPVWYDKLVALSRRLLDIRHIRQSYQVGKIDDQQLGQYMRQHGYSDDDVNVIVETERFLSEQKWETHWTVHAYAEGTLNDADLQTILTSAGARPTDIEFVKFRAQNYAQRNTRAACLKNIKKRFLMGLLSAAELNQSLNDIGLSPQQVDNITSAMNCERDMQGKALGAADLCTLYENGAIDAPALAKGFQELGYSYDNAILLARNCAKRLNDKLTKEQQRQLKEQEQEQQKAEKKIEQDAAKAAQQLRQQQAAAQKMQATQLARTKRLYEAGGNFAKVTGTALPDAIISVQGVYRSLSDQTMWTQDEIIAALLVASKDRSVATIADLTREVNAVLAS